MTVTPEEIMAYVDGEADAALRQRIEAAAQTDPAVAARIAGEQRLREQLRGEFAPLAATPVPPAWEAMIRAAVQPAEPAPVIDLAAARARRDAAAPARRPLWRSAWIGGAMAASLALGLVLGGRWQDAVPVSTAGGALVAQSTLARALDTQLASAGGSTDLRMLATFRGSDGGICRAFAGAQLSGIACRSGAGWQVRHLLPGHGAAQSQYRQAGSGDGELMALAQQMASGEPFDAQQEAAAKASGWR